MLIHGRPGGLAGRGLDSFVYLDTRMHYSAFMDDTTTSLARAIGVRIREERMSRSWTLDHLAVIAGISRRALVNVEQGTANPSVATLLKLSDALGIGLPALVEPPQAAVLTVKRNGEGAALWRSEAGGRALLVAGTEPPDVVELWDWTLAPQDRHVSDAHSTGTRELIHIREGVVLVEASDRSVLLEVGDAVAFPGDVPHAYANPGTIPARFALAVFEPGVGTPGRGETRRR